MPATATAPAPTSAYWIGTDGNVYLKDATGVNNVGTPGAVTAAGGQAVLHPNGVTTYLHTSDQIADPNAPAANTAPVQSGSSSNSSATAPADKSNDIAVLNSQLGAAGTEKSSGLASVAASLASILGGYDTEASQNTASYNTNSAANENNLQKDKQTALVHAAAGRSGLMATLASIGALSGDSVTEANQAVQSGANDDLSGAADTYATNQQGLDTALGQFTAADAARRKDAQTAADAADQQVQNKSASDAQGYYAGLSSDYAAEGDKTNAAKYASLAAALSPSIGSTNVPTPLSAETAAYTAPALSNYLNSGTGTIVKTTPAANANSLPSLAATATKKKTS